MNGRKKVYNGIAELAQEKNNKQYGAHFIITTIRKAEHALFAFDIVENWNDIKVDRMREVLRAKFKQHIDLKEKLLATGDATLIEESKSDAFWGIGKKGNGKNMLGTLLMAVREEIRNNGNGKPDSFNSKNS